MSPSSLRRELPRKAWHLLLLVYLAFYWALGRDAFLPVMGAWTVLVASLETLRLRRPGLQRALVTVFSAIIREHELKGYSGVLYGSLGVLCTAAFFGRDPRVMAAAVASLALGDSSAALVGMAWGRHRYVVRGRSLSWEGTATGFAVALGCGIAAGLPGPAAAFAAAAVAAVDCLPLPPDDNLWIPVASAAAASAALALL